MVKNEKSIMIRIYAVLFIFLIGMFGFQSETVSATSNGSLNIYLNDLGTPMEDVEFTAYRIAVTNAENSSWIFEEELATQNLNVDLNEERTVAEWDEEAMLLSEYVMDTRIQGISGKTETDGNMILSGLEEGMYLVVQDDPAHYGMIAPFLVAIPYQTEDGVWTHAVDVNPKGEMFRTTGEIEITKKVRKSGKAITADEKFYAGIFENETDKNPIRIVELLQGESVKAEVALNEREPVTYYVYETDASGNKVGSSFEYIITGEGPVELNCINYAEDIELINEVKNPKESIQTGDDFNIMFYVTVGLTSIACMIGILLYMRKQNT